MNTKTNNHLSATERYKAAKETQPVLTEIIVLPDSKFEIEMKRLDVLGFVLTQDLPESATNKAILAWKEQGLEGLEETEETLDLQIPEETEEEKNARIMIEIRDKVINDSVNPKLVLGEAKNPNELPISVMSDADLLFLIVNRMGGSESSDAFARFLVGSTQSTGAGTNGKRPQNPRKRSSGNKKRG
jgi:hypothetical protein